MFCYYVPYFFDSILDRKIWSHTRSWAIYFIRYRCLFYSDSIVVRAMIALVVACGQFTNGEYHITKNTFAGKNICNRLDGGCVRCA